MQDKKPDQIIVAVRSATSEPVMFSFDNEQAAERYAAEMRKHGFEVIIGRPIPSPNNKEN